MIYKNNLGFHEAGIVAISQDGGTIHLHLEGVHLNDHVVSDTSVAFVEVRSVTRNDISVEKVFMEYQDGEVLTLDIFETTADLLVLWNDFGHHRDETVAYHIECERVEVRAVSEPGAK